MWKFCKFVSFAYGIKNPGAGEPWEKMHGVSFQCLVGGDASPMCVHREAHTCPGYYQICPWHGERCSAVTGEFMPATRSALATIVQRVVRGQRQPFCGQTQGVAGICAAAPNLAGISKGLQASLRWHPIVQALAGSCGHPCGGTRKHP